jgi:hypothetical protein
LNSIELCAVRNSIQVSVDIENDIERKAFLSINDKVIIPLSRVLNSVELYAVIGTASKYQ